MMTSMDQVVDFLRAFLQADYRMQYGKLSEPDDAKFMALVRAADVFYDGKDFGSGGSRMDDKPASLYASESYRKAAAELHPAPLFAVAEYQHGKGPLYRAWTGMDTTGPRGTSLFYNYYVQPRQGALKIVARYTICTTCLGAGSTAEAPTCRACRGEGWEHRGGARFKLLGRLVAVRKLAAPTDPLSQAAYQAIGE
jgi:hypothetical protein